MTTTVARVTSFTEAQEFLQHGRNKNSRTIANNTKVIRLSDDRIGIRLHQTDVVIYSRSGLIELNTGGWYTVTTKDRINEFTPRQVYVSSVKGRWYLYRFHSWPVAHEQLCPFVDGMMINEYGKRLGSDDGATEINSRVAHEDAENEKVRKQIQNYCKGLTDAKIKELVEAAKAGGVAGDCWFCSMQDVSTGIPWGDKDPSHLLNHLEERYYMISLCLNALQDSHYQDPAFMLQFGGGRTVRQVVGKYLRKRLFQGVVAVR